MRFKQDGDVPFQLEKILNEGLELVDNFRGALLEATLDEGENEVQHGLGFRPVGFMLLLTSEDGRVRATREVDWTTERLFLVSSVKNQKVRLFVL